MHPDVVRARVVGVCRVALALLATVALVPTGVHAPRRGGLVDFFSYFTIESNILGVIVFCWGGVALLLGWRPVSDALRGAVVVYLAITGAVYALLLAGLPGQGIDPWVNTIVHQVMPIVVVLDWLITPPRTAPPWARVWAWLVFPLLYLAYTLLRGPFAHWYPYPFLDPRPQGYSHVVLGAVGVAVGFVVVSLLVRWAGAALSTRSTHREEIRHEDTARP
jgi:hypothetical protein